MKDETPWQNLLKVHRGLWSMIHLVGAVERQIVGNSKAWADLVDVENVLRHTVGEVALIMKRNAGYLENPRNHRPGEELALKAQLAKARQAVADVLNEREDEHSHK